jgi:hypothetical protein
MPDENTEQIKHEPREIPGFLCVSFTIQSGTSWRYIPVNKIEEISLLIDGRVQIDYREGNIKGYNHIVINEDGDTILDRLHKAINPICATTERGIH